MAYQVTKRKITKEYVRQRLKELTEQHKDDDNKIVRMRQLRETTRAVVLPAGKRFTDLDYRDSTIAAEIDRKVAAATLNDPIIRIVSGGEGAEKVDARNTSLEKWFMAAMKQAGSRIAGSDWFYEEAADACYGDGGAWAKMLFGKDLWDKRYLTSPDDFEDDPDYAEEGKGKGRQQKYDEETDKAKKEAGVPVYIISCDALTIYPHWAGTRLAEVFEVTERPLSEVMFEQGCVYDEKGDIFPASEAVGPGVYHSQAPSVVEFIEYWTPTQYAYLIKGPHGEHLCGPFDHDYKRVPYFNAYGRKANYWHGRKIGNSVGQSKAWLVEYLQFLMTLHAQVAAIQSFPVMFRKRGQHATEALRGKNGQPMAETSYRLGTIIEGGLDEDLQILQWPPIAASLKDQIQLVQKMISELDSPKVGGEVNKGLEGAGFAVSTVLSEAKVQDAPFNRHLENMLREMTYFLIYLVTNVIREKIWVRDPTAKGKEGYLVLDPKDLSQPFDLTWYIDPERASAKLVEMRYLHERIKSGTLGLDQAIERMGDNPSEVAFYVALAEIKATDEYKKLRNEIVFQRVGRGDIVAKAVELATTGGIGLGSATTSPPPGGVAVPGPAGQPVALTTTPPGGAAPSPTGNPAGQGRFMPNAANLTQSPNGVGVAAAGVPTPPQGLGRLIPSAGTPVGTTPGAVVPQAGAAAGAGLGRLMGNGR